MEQAAILRELPHAGHRSDLPVSKMAGEQQEPLALTAGADGRLNVLDPDPGLRRAGRHQGQAHELEQEASEVSAVGLGQAADVALAERLAKHGRRLPSTTFRRKGRR